MSTLTIAFVKGEFFFPSSVRSIMRPADRTMRVFSSMGDVQSLAFYQDPVQTDANGDPLVSL